MSFLHQPKKLSEKLKEADFIAFGCKLGKKDGVIDLALQIHVSLAINANLIKAISELINLLRN